LFLVGSEEGIVVVAGADVGVVVAASAVWDKRFAKWARSSLVAATALLLLFCCGSGFALVFGGFWNDDTDVGGYDVAVGVGV